MENGKPTLNHNWQRWFSDLYNYLKDKDSALTNVITAVNNSGAAAPGSQGPQGPGGANGANGMDGSQGDQGAPGLDVNVLADGGFANSVYLTSQIIDGGGAI